MLDALQRSACLDPKAEHRRECRGDARDDADGNKSDSSKDELRNETLDAKADSRKDNTDKPRDEVLDAKADSKDSKDEQRNETVDAVAVAQWGMCRRRAMTALRIFQAFELAPEIEQVAVKELEERAERVSTVNSCSKWKSPHC